MSLRIMVEGKSRAMNFLVAYAPTEVASEAEKSAFYADLQRATDAVPSKESLYLLTDANARTGADSGSHPGVLGPFGRDELNDNGGRLLDYCALNGLALTSTFFRKRADQATFRFANAKVARRRLDYIAVRQVDRKRVIDVGVVPGSGHLSDHFMVVAKVSARIARVARPQRAKTWSLDRVRLKTAVCQVTVAAEVKRRVDALAAAVPGGAGGVVDAQTAADARANALSGALIEGAKAALGDAVRAARQTDWLLDGEDQIRADMEQQRAAWLALAKCAKTRRGRAQVAILRERYRAAAAELRETMRAAENSYWMMKAQAMQKLQDDNETAAFHAAIRAASKEAKGRSELPPVRDEQGRLLTDTAEIAARWMRHFDKLLNEEPTLVEEVLLNMPQLPVDEGLALEPSLGEVIRAIHRLKLDKASGPDGVPIELLKLSAEAVVELHSMCVECWRSGAVPQAWKDAHIVLVFKKGDKALCDNWRGISLLAHAGKVLSKLIAIRLDDYTERLGLLPEEQCGFRRERSTVDMLFVARLLQESGREKKLPLFFVFIDLQKAYDTVPRQGMWIVLSRYGVPALLIALIRAFHDRMSARVRLDGNLSDAFEVKQGLRQGCVMAPLLFNLYFAAVIEETRRRKSAGGVPIKFRFGVDPLDLSQRMRRTTAAELWAMLFADDAALVALSLEDLQDMMTSFLSASAEFGLTVSVKKTQVMIQRRRDEAAADAERSLFSGASRLETVQSFVYLGGVLSETADLDAEIARRRGAAWVAFRKKRDTVFEREGISVRTKVAVLKAYVMSVLLSGAQAWATTAEQVRQLESVHLSFLLSILSKSRRDRVAYTAALAQTKTVSVEGQLRRLRLLWVGRVARMDDGRLPKWLLFGECAGGGPRPRGRPRKTYREVVRNDLASFEVTRADWHVRALDAPAWRREVETGHALFEARWTSARIAAADSRHAREALAAGAAPP